MCCWVSNVYGQFICSWMWQYLLLLVMYTTERQWLALVNTMVKGKNCSHLNKLKSKTRLQIVHTFLNAIIWIPSNPNFNKPKLHLIFYVKSRLAPKTTAPVCQNTVLRLLGNSCKQVRDKHMKAFGETLHTGSHIVQYKLKVGLGNFCTYGLLPRFPEHRNIVNISLLY